MMFRKEEKIPFDRTYCPYGNHHHIRVNTSHPEFASRFTKTGFMFANRQAPYNRYDGFYDIVMMRIDCMFHRPFVDCNAPPKFFITRLQRHDFRRMALYFKTKLLVLEDRFVRKYGDDPRAMEAFNLSIEELIKKVEMPPPFHL